MTINAEEVQHVARLARLHIDPRKVDKIARQMATILSYVDKLEAVDTRQVPPATHATALVNAFREDRQGPHLSPEAVFANAPAQEGDFFTVPKVI